MTPVPCRIVTGDGFLRERDSRRSYVGVQEAFLTSEEDDGNLWMWKRMEKANEPVYQ